MTGLQMSAVLEKARLALGDDFGIAVDANQAQMLIPLLNLQKLLLLIMWNGFEEPVHAFDMEALSAFARPDGIMPVFP